MPSLDHKSKLIENAFTHGPVHPNNELVVYQNVDGGSEILSAGTDGQLYLIKNTPGSITGWSQENQQCPIEPTLTAARLDSRGVLHVAVVNQASMVVATRSRDRDGNWSPWHQLPFEDKIDGATRLLQLELKEASAGEMQFYVLYVQRFHDPYWQYSFRVGRAAVSATNWRILLFVKGRFEGGTKDVNGIRTSIAFVQSGGVESLYFYLPNTSELLAWDGIDSASPVERIAASLPGDALKQFIALDSVVESTLFCIGRINGEDGIFRYSDQVFVQLAQGEFLDIAGTIDSEEVVNLQTVDSSGGLWHTSGQARQAFDQLQEITDEVSRVGAVLAASEGQVFVLTGKDLRLRRYLRSPQSTDWELQDIETESTGSEWVMWYNSRITVVDERKQAVPLHPIILQPDETTVLTVNGRTLTAGPFQPLELEADGNGLLTFMQPAEELANLWVPTLKLRFEDDPPGEWRSKDATGETTERMYNLTGEELRNAKGRNGKAVLPPDEHERADALAAQFSLCASIGRIQKDHGQFTIAEYSGNREMLPLPGFARYSHANGEMNERFDVHDLWEGIKEGTLDVVNVGLKALTDGHGRIEGIVVTITEAAGGLFETVVNHLSQAFNVIRAIFEEVAIVFETALEWLGYLFDWEKIMQRKDALVQMVVDGISQLPQQITDSGIKDKIPATFTSLRASAGIGVAAFQSGTGRDSVGAATESINFTTLGNIFNEIDSTIQVPVTWLLDRLASVLPNGSFITGDLTGPAWTEIEKTFAAFQGQVTGEIQTSLDSLLALFEKLLQMEDPNGLVLNDLVDTFKPAMSGMLTAFENLSVEGIATIERSCQPDGLLSVLNAPARLPLFSEIYGLIHNSSGELPFTLLDFLATVVAIPMHIVLEATGQADLFDSASTDCGAWIAAGLSMIVIGVVAAITHALKEVTASVSAVVPAFWILALIALATLTDWSEVIQVLALLFYMLYQLIDLVVVVKGFSKGAEVMAVIGFLIACVLNIMAAIYESEKEGTDKAVPPWQIVANHVGTLTDFARIADLIWKQPQTKPKQARIVLVIIDILGMGSLAASAFAEYHFCINPPVAEPAK